MAFAGTQALRVRKAPAIYRPRSLRSASAYSNRLKRLYRDEDGQVAGREESSAGETSASRASWARLLRLVPELRAPSRRVRVRIHVHR